MFSIMKIWPNSLDVGLRFVITAKACRQMRKRIQITESYFHQTIYQNRTKRQVQAPQLAGQVVFSYWFYYTDYMCVVLHLLYIVKFILLSKQYSMRHLPPYEVVDPAVNCVSGSRFRHSFSADISRVNNIISGSPNLIVVILPKLYQKTSALNQTLMTSSRHTLAMSATGYQGTVFPTTSQFPFSPLIAPLGQHLTWSDPYNHLGKNINVFYTKYTILSQVTEIEIYGSSGSQGCAQAEA